MKEGTVSNKKIKCKKINRYSKEMVKSELARLDAEKDDGSVYRKHVMKRAAELGM